MNYQYSTECSLSNLKRIREFVKESLRDQNIPDVLLNVIVLAMDEVCSNVMIHAHRCNPDDFIEIHIMRPDERMLIFEIIDDGNVFDMNKFQASNLSSLVEEKKKGGLGIRLVKSIMDEIECDVREGKNVCRLIKKIPNYTRKM